MRNEIFHEGRKISPARVAIALTLILFIGGARTLGGIGPADVMALCPFTIGGVGAALGILVAPGHRKAPHIPPGRPGSLPVQSRQRTGQVPA